MCLALRRTTTRGNAKNSSCVLFAACPDSRIRQIRPCNPGRYTGRQYQRRGPLFSAWPAHSGTLPALCDCKVDERRIHSRAWLCNPNRAASSRPVWSGDAIHARTAARSRHRRIALVAGRSHVMRKAQSYRNLRNRSGRTALYCLHLFLHLARESRALSTECGKRSSGKQIQSRLVMV